jgi:hypothetical protein
MITNTHRMNSFLIRNNFPSFSAKKNEGIDDLENNNLVHSFIQYEDADSLAREKMRWRMLGRIMPEENIGSSLSMTYATSIEDANIPNLQKIGLNCYRGASLLKFPDSFELLKKTGIETVIDLAGNARLKSLCDEHNISYLPYVVDDGFWANPIFRTDKELLDEHKLKLAKQGLSVDEYNSDIEKYKAIIANERTSFMNKFLVLINAINMKDFYIGCECGELRTPNVLALNTFFNPKWDGKRTFPAMLFLYEKIGNMFENIPKSYKEKLGFNPTHEAFIKETLHKFRKI